MKFKNRKMKSKVFYLITKNYRKIWLKSYYNKQETAKRGQLLPVTDATHLRAKNSMQIGMKRHALEQSLLDRASQMVSRRESMCAHFAQAESRSPQAI